MHVFRLKGDFDTLDAYTPLLFDLGARGLEEKPGEVWAYFPQRLELPLPGEWLELPDTDWLEAWRRDLKPVRAGPFVVLAPWHEWVGDELRILLEPGMAFGTGHHETTRMALEALAQHVRPGMRVLDLGTGSGILAIAAQVLGAQAVGIDNDPAVIPQARDNAAANGVDPEFYVGTLEDAQGSFDLIVANLYAELHAQLAPEYPKYLLPGGLMLMTGILRERESLVDGAMRAQGFESLHRRQEGEWMHLTYRKP
ncbi:MULTISPECIES: 50S ribosomal protein L11 methyltransferase [unclassified Meiothermus]|uniref:50S ribosomal protein L11 methyltransferase n=1 Tax=unclassified Meiothermus TaxID=370471 RepID=UPI000D7BFEB0|nr:MULTISPECIES: 50S ribosomal protein L11 methyltransferase [unclassified Meiothermus]PZA06997.1 50S ribosomal protein L11 methyltransferase [Meiothermus sp. Pnk-1]RYM35301.1 50S ribosomal protein L11 methyltransferase [Meiothermus sp. PNK-Is4]